MKTIRMALVVGAVALAAGEARASGEFVSLGTVAATLLSHATCLFFVWSSRFFNKHKKFMRAATAIAVTVVWVWIWDMDSSRYFEFLPLILAAPWLVPAGFLLYALMFFPFE